jgi:hypothetical protein
MAMEILARICGGDRENPPTGSVWGKEAMRKFEGKQALLGRRFHLDG